jgi:hypothetical protein
MAAWPRFLQEHCARFFEQKMLAHFVQWRNQHRTVLRCLLQELLIEAKRLSLWLGVWSFQGWIRKQIKAYIWINSTNRATIRTAPQGASFALYPLCNCPRQYRKKMSGITEKCQWWNRAGSTLQPEYFTYTRTGWNNHKLNSNTWKPVDIEKHIAAKKKHSDDLMSMCCTANYYLTTWKATGEI